MADTFPLKSLWQRKINHNIKKIIKIAVCKLLWVKKKRKKDKNEEVSTDLLCGWKNGTEVPKVRNTRGVIVVHAYSTGLHKVFFYHAQNANNVELPKKISGKACRECCKQIHPLTPQACKLFCRNVLI